MLLSARSRAAPYPLIWQEDDVIGNINEDIRDTWNCYFHNFNQCETLNVEMLCIDGDGFEERAEDKTLSFSSTAMELDAQQARHALVEMAQRAR